MTDQEIATRPESLPLGTSDRAHDSIGREFGGELTNGQAKETEGLSAKLESLIGIYSATADALAQTTASLRDSGAPPDYRLIETLGDCHRRFIQLRTQAVARARTLGHPVSPPSRLADLRDLVHLIEGLSQAEYVAPDPTLAEPPGLPPTEAPVPIPASVVVEAVPVAAPVEPHRIQTPEPVPFDPAIRDAAFALIDKSLRLQLAGAGDLPALDAMHAQARSLRHAIETAPDPSAEPTAIALASGQHPIAHVLTIVEGDDQLNDAQWAELHTSVTEAFGRPLAIAAARSRLCLSAS